MGSDKGSAENMKSFPKMGSIFFETTLSTDRMSVHFMTVPGDLPLPVFPSCWTVVLFHKALLSSPLVSVVLKSTHLSVMEEITGCCCV